MKVLSRNVFLALFLGYLLFKLPYFTHVLSFISLTFLFITYILVADKKTLEVVEKPLDEGWWDHCERLNHQD